MSSYSSDCECCQGIEYFIDPRPYMPSYESPDSGSFKTGYPWVDAMYENDATEAVTTTVAEDSDTDEDGVSLNRIINLYVDGTMLINKGYIHLTAYQVRSYYVKLTSKDSTWLNGTLSLVLQHVETGNQRTIPIEIGKKAVIPHEVLYPGTLKVAVVCLTKSDTYASVLSESLDLVIHDAGIKQVDWGKRPDFDVYYNYQASVRALAKVQEELQKTVAAFEVKCLNLENEVAELKDEVKRLSSRS